MARSTNRARASGARRTARPAPSPAAPRRSGRTLALIAGGALAVVALAIGAGVRARVRGGDTATVATTASGPVTAPSPFPASARVKGSDSAPVTIIEYYDAQCPNCSAWEASVAPRVAQEYIATGKVRMEVRAFPILGAESTRAALATECAGEQGRFWEYRATLFQNQRGENRGAFSDTKLQGFATGLGLDGAAFGACLADGRYQSRIADDLAAGQAAGVTGTPAFLINGRLLVGAYPYADIAAAIDQALAAAGGGR